MWYLIVSIPDLCTLTYFEEQYFREMGNKRDNGGFYEPYTQRNIKKLRQSKEQLLVSSYMTIFICNMIIFREKGHVLLTILI